MRTIFHGATVSRPWQSDIFVIDSSEMKPEIGVVR